jgi:hypothetical protein
MTGHGIECRQKFNHVRKGHNINILKINIMTNKFKNQTNGNLRKNQCAKAFPISEMMDFRSIKEALFALNSYEPEPLFINGQYLYA